MIAPRGNGRGFTLVELLVAIGIGSVIALALTQQVILAHEARRTGARWMRATQLATQSLEGARAGDRSGDDDGVDGFALSRRSEAVPGYPDLERIAVTVTWHDRGEQRFTLEALVPRVR